VSFPSARQSKDEYILGPVDEITLAELGDLAADTQGQPLLIEDL